MTAFRIRLMRMLRIAGDYGRVVWGQELKAARALQKLGLVTVHRFGSREWIAYVGKDHP